jgi:hypothetical protein
MRYGADCVAVVASRALRCAALFLLLACGSPRNGQAPPAASVTAIRDRMFDEEVANNPGFGRDLGLHAFDGKLADYSPAGIAARIARLEERRRTIARIATNELGAEEALDLAELRWDADEQLFWLVDRRSPEADPAFYEDLFAVNKYIDRAYAPLEERLLHLTEHEEGALRQVAFVRSNLRPPLGAPIVSVAVGIYRGYAEYLRTDVQRIGREVKNPSLRERFERANGALADAATELAGWLETVPTNDSHVLGRERFEKLVAIYAGEPISLAEFKRRGEEDLARNQAAYEALEVRSPPRPRDPLATATAFADEARRFLVEHRIVTLPSEERAAVVETPPYKRYNYAWLDMGGPFERPLGASFFITPPDPAWPRERQATYGQTVGELRATTVHEVYPGHFIQGGWNRRAPTRVQKALGSFTFLEGWAHYAEQMMLEEGFGADPEGRHGQLSMALLRDCRYLAALAIHVEDLPMAKAEDRFVNECHQTPAVAKEQAARGAFHPWYFAYTLGKLQILALRTDAKRALGARFSLQRFHDSLLAHGQGPIGLIRPRVLQDLTGPRG